MPDARKDGKASAKPAGQLPKSPTEGKTCLNCRKSKVKCSKETPCSRCVRLDLVCEQVDGKRPRGRPLKLHVPIHKKIELSSLASVGLLSSTLPNPTIFVNAMLRTYVSLVDTSMLDQGKTAGVLRVWDLYLQHHKKDLTYGVLPNVVTKFFGQSKRCTSIPAMASPVAQIKGAAFDFSSLNPLSQSLDDGISAHSGAVFLDGDYRMFCNGIFSRVFKSQEECNSILQTASMLPSYIWGSVLHPDDYEEFFQKVAKNIFSKENFMGEFTHKGKVVDNKGRAFAALTRMRYLYVEGGKQLVILLSVVPIGDNATFENYSEVAEEEENQAEIRMLSSTPKRGRPSHSDQVSERGLSDSSFARPDTGRTFGSSNSVFFSDSILGMGEGEAGEGKDESESKAAADNWTVPMGHPEAFERADAALPAFSSFPEVPAFSDTMKQEDLSPLNPGTDSRSSDADDLLFNLLS